MRAVHKIRSYAMPALLAFAAPLHADVVYRNEINLAGHTPFLQSTSAPYDTSDPLYNASTTSRPWVETSSRFYTLDPETGAATPPGSLPASVKKTTDSFESLAGINTSDPTLFVLGFRQTLYILSLGGPTPTTRSPYPPEGVTVPVGQVRSLAAADRNRLSVIADGGLYTINIATGDVTQIFNFDGGTGAGHFSNFESAGADRETRFHTYGPNGLLYVLDYGNNRMQLLDPANAFAYVSEFAFNPGVRTENMQFAIGKNGNVYLGDGLGGGATYDANGNFLGTFGLPEPMSSDEPGAAPRIFTDASGGVYVFDLTGNHQYFDASAVPEPAETSLFIGGGALALALVRRRKRARGE